MAEHFNGLTPAQAERLAILAEECGEVVQVVGKILRHGFENARPQTGTSNRLALELELGDVVWVTALLRDAGDVNWNRILEYRHMKDERAAPFLHHQSREETGVPPRLSASEALFGFMGWLTSRDPVETFSARHDAAKAADLVAQFISTNGLDMPRDGWERTLKHPPEPTP